MFEGYEETGNLSLDDGATAIDDCGLLQFISQSNRFLELQTFYYSLKGNFVCGTTYTYTYCTKLEYYNNSFPAHTLLGLQNPPGRPDFGAPEFGTTDGVGTLPETDVDYSYAYLNPHLSRYKKSSGITSAYAVNVRTEKL